MNLISLNTWAGKIHEPFIQFLEKYKSTVDVFCFQEVFHNHLGVTSEYVNHDHGNKEGLATIQNILNDFVLYFSLIDSSGTYGLLTCVRKGIDVTSHGEVVLYENPSYDYTNDTHDHNRKMQWVTIKGITICNIHGFWSNTGKGDTPERILQSEKIVKFLDTNKTPVVLVGDLNLNPDTESIKRIESGLRNMIIEYDIKSTRTVLHDGESKYADYAFVSSSLKVDDFKVLPDVVSDHAPLFISLTM